MSLTRNRSADSTTRIPSGGRVEAARSGGGRVEAARSGGSASRSQTPSQPMGPTSMTLMFGEQEDMNEDGDETGFSSPWTPSGDSRFLSASYRRAQTQRTVAQNYVARIVCNPYFDLSVGFLILVQVALVVYETDTRAAGKRIPQSVEIVTWFFLLFYVAEVSSRIFVFRRRFFHSSINVLDVFVVVLDLVVESLGTHGVPSVSILRVLRVFRVARVLRSARTFSVFRELYMIIHGFFSAMKAIVWATVLLCFMLTLWGIIAVEIIHPLNVELAETGAFDGCERCGRAFASVPEAALTFVQQIVAGDSWGLISIPIIESYPATGVFFITVLISVELGLMNLILSVIVDKAQQAHEADRQFQLHQRQQAFQQAKRNLFRICREIDEDDSGNLTLKELEDGFEENIEFHEQMRAMDVHKEDLSSLFKILDEDGSGEVNYKEFVEQLHKMKTMDAQVMLVFIRSSIKEIRASFLSEIAAIKEDLKQNKATSLTHENQNSQIIAVLHEVHKHIVPPGSVAAAAFNIERANVPEPADSKACVPLQEKKVREHPSVEAAWAVTHNPAHSNRSGTHSEELQKLPDEDSMDQQLRRLREQISGMDASLQQVMQSALKERSSIAATGASSSNRPVGGHAPIAPHFTQAATNRPRPGLAAPARGASPASPQGARQSGGGEICMFPPVCCGSAARRASGVDAQVGPEAGGSSRV